MDTQTEQTTDIAKIRQVAYSKGWTVHWGGMHVNKVVVTATYFPAWQKAHANSYEMPMNDMVIDIKRLSDLVNNFLPLALTPSRLRQWKEKYKEAPTWHVNSIRHDFERTFGLLEVKTRDIVKVLSGEAEPEDVFATDSSEEWQGRCNIKYGDEMVSTRLAWLKYLPATKTTQ